MKTILLKLSGQLLSKQTGLIEKEPMLGIIDQVKQLVNAGYRFGIVIGGGNFFRGAQDGQHLQMQRSAADQVGMLATIMNSIILQDLLQQAGLKSLMLSSIAISGVIDPITPVSIDQGLLSNACILFAGGTGCPYFSTDTNAVVRALQIGAIEIWKGTDVDYVYDADPAKNTNAKPLVKLTFQEALNQKLRVMDMTAFCLAQDHELKIRIFNVLQKNALLNVANDASFGSTIAI